jgi:muconolactone delta-isomerase
MRALVVVRMSPPFPQEHEHEIVEAFVAWRAKYRQKMEGFEFFVGNGGFVLANVVDEAELNRMVMEFPLLPWAEIEVEPVVEGDLALEEWKEAVEAQLATA